MSALNVGDPVLFVPSEDQAFDRYPSGEYAFRFYRPGRRPGDPDVELDQAEMAGLKRVYGALLTANDSPVRIGQCRAFWPAVVASVNPDGTADLSITATNGFVTLHYKRVPHSTDKKPHTFHLAGE